jgi:hypothetical protein
MKCRRDKAEYLALCGYIVSWDSSDPEWFSVKRPTEEEAAQLRAERGRHLLEDSTRSFLQMYAAMNGSESLGERWEIYI